jgi:hypothetical protein
MGETNPLGLIASIPGIDALEHELLIGGNAERLLNLGLKKSAQKKQP